MLLLSRDSAYEYLSRVLAVEVTSRVHGIPQETALGVRERMSQSCVAHLDNLRAVPKSALRERAGTLAPRRIEELKRALGYALGWTELTMR